MSSDEQLMLIFGTLHLVALGLGALLFVMFLRSDGSKGTEPPEENEGGGGGSDRISDTPKTSPSGRRPRRAASPCPTPSPHPCACAATSASRTCCPSMTAAASPSPSRPDDACTA